ncbi:TrmH family RNA methyltransferase [Ihubacter sp. mB4P-1]
MKEIRSRENRIYKECQKLAQKKYRDREGKYLIEGFNLMQEVPRQDLCYMILREDTLGEGLPDGEKYVMDGKLFDRLAQTETSQGVIAVVRKRQYTVGELGAITTENSNFVVLDRLQDPGNIGTIIRTAEGAGYAAVVAVKGTADIFSPKTIRAAAGSVFRIPIVHVEDGRELRELADSLGKKLVVTSLNTDTLYFDADLSCATALVIGNEGGGVSDELIQLADVRVRIPMEGSLESLNAAVAAGILMYEAQRRNFLCEV